MKINSGKLKEQNPVCETCGTVINGFTGKDGTTPKDGDYSICLYCHTPGKYAHGTTKIKPLTSKELHEIKNNEKLYDQFLLFDMFVREWGQKQKP